MSDIIATLTRRIEAYRTENKNPCKNYSTQSACEKAISKVAAECAIHFSANPQKETAPARYVVFFNEAWQRWVGAVDMTELMSRKDFTGGYLGFCSSKGFYTF